jgi:hypothetical protein
MTKEEMIAKIAQVVEEYETSNGNAVIGCELRIQRENAQDDREWESISWDGEKFS